MLQLSPNGRNGNHVKSSLACRWAARYQRFAGDRLSDSGAWHRPWRQSLRHSFQPLSQPPHRGHQTSCGGSDRRHRDDRRRGPSQRDRPAQAAGDDGHRSRRHAGSQVRSAVGAPGNAARDLPPGGPRPARRRAPRHPCRPPHRATPDAPKLQPPPPAGAARPVRSPPRRGGPTRDGRDAPKRLSFVST